MRIDLYLVENGLCDSRTEAKNFILSGDVRVSGKVITKPSYDVTLECPDITVDKSAKKYVSRGGLKLEEALLKFGVSVNQKKAIDIGASSGGFTDCLLKHGAERVIAVDSGSDQLAPTLLSDKRVKLIENYNARFMSKNDFEFIPDIAVMDVSFISATYIIPALSDCLKAGGEFICLIKPQFEVGREGLGKGGIVKSEAARKKACDKVCECAVSYGFTLKSIIESSIAGKDGNIEYLGYFVKREDECEKGDNFS